MRENHSVTRKNDRKNVTQGGVREARGYSLTNIERASLCTFASLLLRYAFSTTDFVKSDCGAFMKIGTKIISGYAFGFVQPCLIAEFDPLWTQKLDVVESLCESLFGETFQERKKVTFGATDKGELWDHSVGHFMLLADELNRRCGDMRFSAMKIVNGRSGKDEYSFRIACPSLSPALVRKNLQALISFLGQCKTSFEISQWESFCSHQAMSTRSLLPAGTNAGNFISLAAKCRVPFHIFSPNHIIFGYGNGSRLLNSSIVESESAIGFQLANNKHWTNRFLKLAGLPVAKQCIVRSDQQAVSRAAEIGYPVVLKPVREEQGRGVIADIRNERELLQGFTEISKNYQHILLEEYVVGRLFRINTFQGEVIRVVERIPAEIVGNGIATVAELIENLNKEPDRSCLSSTKNKVAVDEDVIASLLLQGFSLECVPSQGEHITLTSLSKVNNGGSACEVKEDFHPENLLLCKEVAQSLRLQVSGIDFLSIDPSFPWYENDAVICEVNAKPQLGTVAPSIYARVFNGLEIGFPDVRLIVSNTFDDVNAPIFRKSLKQIEINASPAYLAEHGCPTQYYSEIVYDSDVSNAQRNELMSFLECVSPNLEDVNDMLASV